MGARAKLEHPAARAVFVTDAVSVTEKDWPQLHVVAIAPFIGSSVARFLADGSKGDL
jgi:phosphoribosylpyrophosphate synthetase